MGIKNVLYVLYKLFNSHLSKKYIWNFCRILYKFRYKNNKNTNIYINKNIYINQILLYLKYKNKLNIKTKVNENKLSIKTKVNKNNNLFCNKQIMYKISNKIINEQQLISNNRKVFICNLNNKLIIKKKISRTEYNINKKIINELNKNNITSDILLPIKLNNKYLLSSSIIYLEKYNMDLFDYYNKYTITNNNIIFIYNKLLQILLDLKKINIIHGDISLENILVNINNNNNITDLKLFDFENDKIHRYINNRTSIEDCNFTNKVDVWSFGILLFMLIIKNTRPFSSEMLYIINNINIYLQTYLKTKCIYNNTNNKFHNILNDIVINLNNFINISCNELNLPPVLGYNILNMLKIDYKERLELTNNYFINI